VGSSGQECRGLEYPIIPQFLSVLSDLWTYEYSIFVSKGLGWRRALLSQDCVRL
jgi:hypothetical protein